MSVRKRTWTTANGEERTAWIVDYTDQGGARHIETFKTKTEAKNREDEVGVNVRTGTHVAPSKSIKLRDAANAWLEASERELERATVDQYRQHLKYHLLPFIGGQKLTDITTDVVLELQTRLLKEGRSKVMVQKVLVTLGAILSDAQLRRKVGHNAVREVQAARRKKRKSSKREKPKLEIGKHIPLPAELAAILANAKAHWRPLLVVAAFTGLRASELRGLHWKDVDLKRNEVHVRQRADRYNVMGDPKTDTSRRVVPFGKVVCNTLKEWKLKSKHDLVFPNGEGNVEWHANIVNRGFKPAVMAAGIVTKDGKPKYTGLHALRHFYASLCINRREDGGFGLLPKNVQERMGHSSITVTMDTYGHLFPRANDSKVIDAVEGQLVAT